MNDWKQLLQEEAKKQAELSGSDETRIDPLTVTKTLLKRFRSLGRGHAAREMHQTSSLATLRSRYRVNWFRPIGEGTFGTVYSATDRATGEKVALKKLPKKFTDDVSFTREMDALMHIREEGGHPNICGLRENFEEGNH